MAIIGKLKAELEKGNVMAFIILEQMGEALNFPKMKAVRRLTTTVVVSLLLNIIKEMVSHPVLSDEEKAQIYNLSGLIQILIES